MARRCPLRLHFRWLDTYPCNLVLAEASFYSSCSAYGPYVRVFPPAARGEGSALGSFFSVLVGFGLPIDLLHRCTGLRVACWRPPFVGLHDSVVASGVHSLRPTIHVP